MGQCFPHIRRCVFLWMGLLCFGPLIVSNGQYVPQTPSQEETQAEAENKTVVDMTVEELRQFYPNELSGLKFDLNQDQLDYLLKRAGDRVITFFSYFPNTASKEQVRLQRYLSARQDDRMKKRSQPSLLERNMLSGTDASIAVLNVKISEVLSERSEVFNYLILPESGKTGMSWVEDRADKKNRPVNQTAIPGYIMSSGHAGYCQYLHPSHQPNSHFRYLGREKKKPRAHVIAFAQKPEAGDYMSQFSEATSHASIRFLVQGFVWLDPDTYQILRMRTDLLLPERKTELTETITDIYYDRVKFRGALREFWLPQEINVSWEFPQTDRLNLIYRNQHRYSDYHLFSVESDYKIAQPDINKRNPGAE